jgi:hypothetical protein
VMSLAPAPLAIPLPIVNGQLRMVCQHAQPCRCTGHCHRPRAPSPPDEVLPSHPHPMLEGLPTPTKTLTTLAPATSPCFSVVSSPPTFSTTSPTPSLLPFTFSSEVLLSLGEGPPIHFVLVIHHHRSAHDTSTNLVMLANVMAPGPPIHRSTFFVGGIINPALPINNQSTWNGWA